jgi:hypothetical protein
MPPTAPVSRRSLGLLPARQHIEGYLTATICPPGDDRCSSPAWLVVCTGEGELSHIGRVTWAASHCSYLTPEGAPNVCCGEPKLVMVTRSGEEIDATYDGRLLTDWRYVGLVRFTGGSGEFSEISGSLQAIAMIDPTTSRVSVRGWGWMVL